MACIVMAYRVTAYVVVAYIVMACIVMACIGVAYIVMAYIVVAYVVMAYIVVAYIVMAYIVMAVSVLPPSADRRILVSFESRYGTNSLARSGAAAVRTCAGTQVWGTLPRTCATGVCFHRKLWAGQ